MGIWTNVWLAREWDGNGIETYGNGKELESWKPFSHTSNVVYRTAPFSVTLNDPTRTQRSTSRHYLTLDISVTARDTYI